MTSDHDYYGVGIHAHYIIRMEKIILRATAYLVIVNGREEAASNEKFNFSYIHRHGCN